jgi:hypothetical protein
MFCPLPAQMLRFRSRPRQACQSDPPGFRPSIHRDPSSTSSSMIINLKTAKALDLTVPRILLAAASDLIA